MVKKICCFHQEHAINITACVFMIVKIFVHHKLFLTIVKNTKLRFEISRYFDVFINIKGITNCF